MKANVPNNISKDDIEKMMKKLFPDYEFKWEKQPLKNRYAATVRKNYFYGFGLLFHDSKKQKTISWKADFIGSAINTILMLLIVVISYFLIDAEVVFSMNSLRDLPIIIVNLIPFLIIIVIYVVLRLTVLKKRQKEFDAVINEELKIEN